MDFTYINPTPEVRPREWGLGVALGVGDLGSWEPREWGLGVASWVGGVGALPRSDLGSL